MVLKADGMSPYMPPDFSVGTDIAIFGRQIRIIDADPYTREFFTRIGIDQAEAQ